MDSRKIDPQSGQAIVTAEAILFDILARVCGLPVKRSDLDAMRPGSVRLAGMVSDGTRTIQNQLDEILQSAGMTWSAALPGWAMLWQDGEGLGVLPNVLVLLSMHPWRSCVRSLALLRLSHWRHQFRYIVLPAPEKCVMC
ncbi:hypothetical protein CCP4SC76_8080004 [Gammaproteobacteria bacterium]